MKRKKNKRKQKPESRGPLVTVLRGVTPEEMEEAFEENGFTQDPKTGSWNKVEFYLRKP